MKGSLRTTILLRSVRWSAIVRTAALLALTLLPSFHAFASDGDLADKLKVDYPSTKVGDSMMRFNYSRITAPGPVLTVRIPGIYADPAGSPEGSKKSCNEKMTACCRASTKDNDDV